MEDKPHWLLRMENGGIAEARTKAFLMDRFWILERSVDIQGADFIIQRRLTSKNILDATPPRFGVIQVKYYQNTNTSQYLQQEYICDIDGQPRKEFFLVVHTGVGDHSECFLLSSKDILSDFLIVDSSKTQVNKYYLPGSQVLSNKYKITSFSRALDRIERSLLFSNFQENRSFMSWILPSFSEISIDHIENEYTLPLENWYADIPQGIFDLKKNIEMIMYDLSELTSTFNTVLNETDPLKILGILEGIYSYFAQSFPLGDNYYDSELHDVVLYHKKIFDSLRTEGLLENFFDLQNALGNFICSDLVLHTKLDSSFAYVINVSYNKNDLANYSFHSKIVPLGDITEDNKRLFGFISSLQGNIEAYVIPGRLGFGTWKNGEYSGEGVTDWHGAIKERLWIIRRPIMEKIYEVS
ncbi:hypothetical protein EBB07_13050 [Paenibacillaceae bacterium]|nr:hypothetical protein EBB07_13050 [Paenibacillaceae bacterium]